MAVISSTTTSTENYPDPVVTMNIPALIRIFELIREDVVSDALLHFVVERIIAQGQHTVITMDNYADIASIVPQTPRN